MDRRRFLALASSVGLAGCAGSRDGPDVSDADTGTTSDRETTGERAGTETPADGGTGATDTATTDADASTTTDAAASTETDTEPGQVVTDAAAVGQRVAGSQFALVVRETARVTALGDQTPEEGMEYLVVLLTAKNVGDDAVYLNTGDDVGITRSGGELQSTLPLTQDPGTPDFWGGSMVPGELMRGSLVFEVPAGETGYYFGALLDGSDAWTYVDLDATGDSVVTLEESLSVERYAPGTTRSYGDVSVTVHGFETRRELGGDEAPEGQAYVLADLTFENGSDEALRNDGMELKAGDGRLFKPEWLKANDLDDGVTLEEVAAGDSLSGRLTFLAPAGQDPLYLTWESPFEFGPKVFWQLR